MGTETELSTSYIGAFLKTVNQIKDPEPNLKVSEIKN
jgi:hypothetical protein